MRNEWVRFARQDDPKLCRMHVAFARNAHAQRGSWLRRLIPEIIDALRRAA
jgi:hypothetical protein